MRLSKKKIFKSAGLVTASFFLLGLIISFQPLHGQETSKILYSKDFGVVGDGITNDGPAIRKAIAAAVEAAPGVRLVFEPGLTCRMNAWTGNSQISLSETSDISIEGNGSRLLLHPENGAFSLTKCRKVTVKGFIINYDPLPFTQGTIRAVDAVNGTFDLGIQDNYPLPPSPDIVEQYSSRGWNWGSVMDPVERHRRWDVSDHYFMESVKPLEERIYRIKVTDTYIEKLAPVVPGDRFVFSFMVTEKGESTVGSIVTVNASSACTIEDITIHTARYGMNFAVTNNEGMILLKNNKIVFEEGSTNLITTHKDGMHCKDNRHGPVIENCYFEGMLDDGINISVNTAMASIIHSPTEFTLKGPAFHPEDEVMVFDPQSGDILAETKVIKAVGNRITLAEPLNNIVIGNKIPHADILSTHFYNMSYANNCFVIRSCTFNPQRRHAMLIRSGDGIIENNLIDGVGGAAVWMGNEMGSFYEGPFPFNNIIRNNTIRNTQQRSIYIYTSSINNNVFYTKDIQVENNEITVLPGNTAIKVFHASNVELLNNKILDQNGDEIGDAAVEINK